MFFKWVVPWQEDTSKTALANPMEQCSAQCLGRRAIVKTLSAEHSGAQVLKNTRRGTLLPETGPLVYVWRQRQPASIRQLPCDFVRETPGDVQPVPGKRGFLLIPLTWTGRTEFLTLQWTQNNSPSWGPKRWMVPQRWLGLSFLARCVG